jgi:hypothetical protein
MSFYNGALQRGKTMALQLYRVIARSAKLDGKKTPELEN